MVIDTSNMTDEQKIKELIAKAINTTPDDITLEPYRTGENDETSNDKQLEALAHTKERDGNNMQSEDTICMRDSCEPDSSIANMFGVLPSGKVEPNEQQRDAIEFDINSDLRVLAGPGSGKTYVMALRYEYLVNSGISPQNILVCTFGKEASLEMAKRIQKLIPQANLETICTINALCYRLLVKWNSTSRWYGWKMPKEWQEKETLEEVIGPIWREKEKPGAKEILKKINTTKALGFSTDDSYQWFVDISGQQYGEWLYNIRSKFDAWLNRNRFITYADQLYLVEKKLQSDENWRTGLQERFSQVIVDEAQDCTFQAMRILVTISLEPGMNTVYEPALWFS